MRSHQQCIPWSPCTTYGNTGQLFQSYEVSSTMYSVISNAQHTETLDRCFNLIMSHQQCIPWFPRTTYGNTGQLFQSYYVSSTMYTVISTHDIRKHWTAVSILWGLINNVYRDLHARPTETIDRCYNHIIPHQQCIPSSQRTTYGNNRPMLQSYYVSSTMYTVISTHDIRKL